MDDPANAADDERGARRALPRLARPRASNGALRVSTPPISSRSFETLDSSDPETADSPPIMLTRARSFASEPALRTEHVLREISNPGSRKDKRRSHDSKGSGPDGHTGLENGLLMHDHSVGRSESTSQPKAGPRPLSRRHRLFGSRTSQPRSAGHDTSKYVESLEAQLAALQMQLQSTTSPSISRSNSSKLRALNAETRSLRQELSDWESKFHERVREQLEQHDLIAGSLRARIRFLEKERDNEERRFKDLEADLESKTGLLAAADRSYQALEARLDAMSTLVSTPPAKSDRPSEPSRGERPRPPRPHSFNPTSMGSPVAARHSRGFSLNRPFDSPFQSPHARRYSEAYTPWDHALDSGTESAKDSGYVTELTSEMSDGHLREGSMTSPGRPSSWAPSTGPDSLPRSRPSRKMRRFFGGNTAQSLILPAARSAGDAAVSAPVSASSTGMPTPFIPTLSSPIRERFPVHSPHSSRGSISFDFPPRSATLDPRNEPTKADRLQDANEEGTPRAGFARTATSSMETGPSNLVGGFHFVAQESESPNSCMAQQGSPTLEDAATSDLSTLTGPSLPPLSPKRPNLRPGLAGASRGAQPNAIVRNPSSPLHAVMPSSPRRPSRIGRLIDYVQHSFEVHMYAARGLFESTWQDLVLSRPILEFRCWMVRVLLGRLRDKGSIFVIRRSARSASMTNLAGLGLRTGVGSPAALGDAGELTEEQLTEFLVLDSLDDGGPPLAPPIHWLRFSMTLICAVGVAIKDGPASLFPKPRVAASATPTSHSRSKTLYQLLVPHAGPWL